MKIDSEKTLQKLKWTVGRKRQNLWCSPEILRKFKAACEVEGLDFSPVLQDLLEQLLAFKKKPTFSIEEDRKRKVASFYCSSEIKDSFSSKCKEWAAEPAEILEALMIEYKEQIEDKHGVELK